MNSLQTLRKYSSLFSKHILTPCYQTKGVTRKLQTSVLSECNHKNPQQIQQTRSSSIKGFSHGLMGSTPGRSPRSAHLVNQIDGNVGRDHTIVRSSESNRLTDAADVRVGPWARKARTAVETVTERHFPSCQERDGDVHSHCLSSALSWSQNVNRTALRLARKR